MDTKKRTFVKTLFFKIGTTSITALYFGDVSGAIKLHIILTLFYIIYERIWCKIKWGCKFPLGEIILSKNENSSRTTNPK